MAASVVASHLRRPFAAIVLVVSLSAQLSADSYSAASMPLGLNYANGSTSRIHADGGSEVRGITPHWNSSLLLDAGGEDIQLQIMRATWGRIRQESVRRSVMFLPPASAGIVLFGSRNQALESDFYRDVVVKVIRKLLYPSRTGKKRNPPRCRHNPDGPGCG